MSTRRTVAVDLIARFSSWNAGFKAAGKTAKDFGGELENLRKNNAAGMRDIEHTAGVAGAALAGLAGWAVKVGLEFNKQMSEVGAVSGATSKELDQLRRAALDAGQATVFSATEAAKAESELAKAGLSTSDILGGALAGSLDLASAGSLDLAEAADVAAKSMRIFKLGGGDVGHIADVLAAGANKSATDVHELGEALRMGGLAASNANMTLDETVGVLAAFGDRALIGSDAGTSLKTMLQFLANPTTKARNLMKDLGIQVYDTSGNLLSITAIAGQLRDKLGGLTQQQRQQAFATIFGADATRAATVLYELGAQGMDNYIRKVNDAGAAQRTAAEKTNNLAGDLERLRGTVDALAIDSQEGANGGLRFVVQALDHLVSGVSAIPGPVQTAIFILGGLTGAALLTATAFGKVRQATAGAMEAMRDAGPVGTRAADVIGKVGTAAGRAAGAMVALQTSSAILSTIAGDLNPQMDALADSVAEYGRTGKKAGEATRVLGDDFEHLSYDLGVFDTGFWTDVGNGVAGVVEGLTGLGGVMDESLQHAHERIQTLDSALTQLVQSGRADEAAAAFRRIAEEGAKQGISLRELQAALPGYTAAVAQAAKGTDQAALSADAAAASAKTLAGSLEDAAKEAGSLVDVWDQLHGATVTADQALLSARDAVDALKRSFEDNGRAINGNSDAALRNRVAMEAAARKAVEAAQAYYEQTGDLAGAAKMLKEYEDRAIKAAGATGKERTELQKFADQLYKLPSQKTVTVTTKYVYQDTGKPGTHHDYRWGGIAMAAGGTLPAHIATSPSVLYGERETGGEAFIPRHGDRSRSLGVLQTAASWLGAQVVAGNQRQAQQIQMQPSFQVAVYVGNEQLRDATVRVIQTAPEQVALAARQGEKRLAYT